MNIFNKKQKQTIITDTNLNIKIGIKGDRLIDNTINFTVDLNKDSHDSHDILMQQISYDVLIAIQSAVDKVNDNVVGIGNELMINGQKTIISELAENPREIKITVIK